MNMPAAIPPPSCKVYTPDSLATAIVNAVGDMPGSRWLEPSHGQGSFLRAIAAVGVPKNRLVAVDLEHRPSKSDRLARTQRGVDFLKWSSTTRLRFDRIVGNPPYVSIRRLTPSLLATASDVRNTDGIPIGIGGNLWHAFVLASLRVLACGGTLAFVLPSAAEYANYSAQLRDVVRSRFDVLELYRCRRPLFDGVQEGTVVAIATGYDGGPCRFRRREFDSRNELICALNRRQTVVRRRCPQTCVRTARSGTAFRDVATIRLGGVTGDAKFFLLTEAERSASRLPLQACTPVVSRCRHLKAAVLNSAIWQRLRDSGERVWLFNPSQDVLEHEAVQRRLMLNESEGGCRRSAFKVAVRNPWYRTPLPDNPHGFISGMQSIGPWIAMNEMPGLNATNTLYVVHFTNALTEDERFTVALSFLTTGVRKQLSRIARRYADGLLKLEPGGLLGVRLPIASPITRAKQIYADAVCSILGGDLRTARLLADSRFAS
jgi:adenine-specific DNA-methyltransferase